MTYHPDESTLSDCTGVVSFYNGSGGLVSSSTYHRGYTSWYKVRGGGNSPGWPDQRTTNSYTHAWLKGHLGLMDLNFRNSLTGESYVGQQPPDTNLPYESMEGITWPSREAAFAENRRRVVNGLLDHLSQNKVNIAQFFAERDQTARLVVSTARRLAQSYTSLRRGNFRGALTYLFGSSSATHGRRIPGGIPEQWLALQYGWKPLLSDIYGSCEELARMTQQVEPEAYTVSASATTPLGEASYRTNGDGGWIPPTRWESSGGSIHGHGSIATKVALEFLNQVSRTGLINPLTLGWELLPYSFVVDWFYPVGDFLSRCNATDGLTFSRGYISQKCQMSWTGHLDGGANATFPWSGTTSGGNHSAEFFTFRREALTWFPAPEWPSFKDPFSPTHVANALSLLATAFGRGPRVR